MSRGAPSITAPAAVSVSKNTAFTFSGGNAVSVSDPARSEQYRAVDAARQPRNRQVRLVERAESRLGANKSASLTVSGTLTNLDHDLAGLVYTPTSGYYRQRLDHRFGHRQD